MDSKDTELEDRDGKIIERDIEDEMKTAYINYAMSVIVSRALPDVRDGLKPVQRRILYSMYRSKNTYDKPTRKSAKAVGDIMGNFHPHGDSSIYDAIVRMSQWWKQNTPLIDMQGNNGSMDGDGAAAMRYTEARLSKISNEFLRDIDKDTVLWTRNYDDTLMEPTVLPARFPNLLVNGSNGISAGYATNIPPHNLSEIIDATVKRIKNPNCTLEDIMEIVKGPDFPTGAIVEGKEGIIEAFRTGRGKIIVKAKTEFVKNKGKEQIVISEIPYEVNKQLLVKKINDLRIDKKIEGIADARDESDKDGLSIVIDLKKDADKDLVLNYLFKNTELQVAFSYNMVAIVNLRPMTLGIIDILDAYIAHQKEVVTRRTNFDLSVAKKEHHITAGLIKALSILDDVIATIRASKNKEDSINNLVKKFDFTVEQATAIVNLQLYRLTNYDIVELNTKNNNLQIVINGLEEILADPNKLRRVMIDELNNIKKEYGHERLTEIRDEITEIKIEPTKIIPKEDVIVVVTKEGYIKRSSLRSYNSNEETLLKENDYVIGKYQINTAETILLFTDLGNYLYIPVYEIPDLKWKELGKHISNLIKLEPEESIIYSTPVYDFEENKYITHFTKNGMVKRTPLKEFKVQRYSKPISCIKLKGDDKVVTVTIDDSKFTFIVTHNGYGLTFLTEEIPVTGIKSGGVKSITLKNDYVISGDIYNELEDVLVIATDKNTMKRIRLNSFEITSRARKGVLVIRDVKTNPYYIIKAFISTSKNHIGLKTKNNIDYIKLTEIPLLDRVSTGSSVSKLDLLDVFVQKELESCETTSETKTVENKPSLSDIDEKILNIDDFLDDFKV